MPETEEILSIELNKDVHLEDKLYRIKRGSTVRLVPGASLLGCSVAVNTNFPLKGINLVYNIFNILIQLNIKFYSNIGFHSRTIYHSNMAHKRWQTHYNSS